MACDDVTSAIHVRVDLDDRLIDYDYYKITCGREINADSRLKALCTGQPIQRLAATSLDAMAGELHISDEDERFVLFLEWDALQNAISQYLGLQRTSASGRYQVAAISFEMDCIEIRQNILPLGQTAADSAAKNACAPGCRTGACASCGI